MADDDSIFYRLDARDRIVEAGSDAWDEFARQNGDGKALRVRIEGTSLYAHVAGEASRMFVWTMLDGVRKLGRSATKLYRCDSPQLKRHMEMTITPSGNGGLLVTHRTVRTEPMLRPVSFAAKAGRTSRLLLRCSMCNRLRIDGAWREPDAADLSPQKLPQSGAVAVAYGICEPCSDIVHQPARQM